HVEQSHGEGGWDRPRVKSLGKKIRSSPDGLARLYAFRMLQPPWMPYSLYRWVSESRAKRFLETSLKRDFPEAHLRMKGIGQKNLGCEGLNPLSPIECGRLEVWYYRLRIRKEMFYLS